MHVPDQQSPAQVCTYQTSSLQHKCAGYSRRQPATMQSSKPDRRRSGIEAKEDEEEEGSRSPASPHSTHSRPRKSSEHNGTRKHAAYMYYIASRCLVAAKRSRQSAQRHYTTSAHSEHRFPAPSSRKDVVNQCLQFGISGQLYRCGVDGCLRSSRPLLRDVAGHQHLQTELG